MDEINAEIYKFTQDFSQTSMPFNVFEKEKPAKFVDYSTTNFMEQVMKEIDVNSSNTTSLGNAADTPIQQTYTPVTLDTRAEEYLTEGSLLFCERIIDVREDSLHQLFDLPTLNGMFKTSYKFFKQALADEDVFAKKFDEFVKDNGEEKLKYYTAISNDAVREYEGITLNLEEKKELRDMTKSYYNNLTAAGIVNSFNFIGTGLTRNSAIDEDSINKRLKESTRTDVNALVSGPGRVANVFGSKYLLKPWTRLFLVLRKLKEGYYQIRPEFYRGENEPSDIGVEHIFYVGIIREIPMESFDVHNAEKAICNTNNLTSFKALGSLELLRINFRNNK